VNIDDIKDGLSRVERYMEGKTVYSMRRLPLGNEDMQESVDKMQEYFGRVYVTDEFRKDAGLLGVMTASVVLEDTLLLKEALIQLKSYFFARTDPYVQNPGPGWKIKKDYRGIYLPREVERNEGSSGLTYTAYALTTMTQSLEIARYAGYNFWHDSTEEQATIKDVIEQFYTWNVENNPFPWHPLSGKTSAGWNT